MVDTKKQKLLFQTKVVWFWWGHKIVPLIWLWVVLLRSNQSQIDF